jgi:hypothetical protein
VLALFLNDSLKGRASHQERIYDLGSVAQYGILAPGMKERFLELYLSAPKILSRFGFDPSSLENLIPRIEGNESPARDMIAKFQRGIKLEDIIKDLSSLHTLSGQII